jgi:hypothetical protein
MNKILRPLALGLALLAAFCLSAPSVRASVAVKSLSIQFNTLDDAKAAGSSLSVFLQNPAGQVVAGTYDFAKGPLAVKSASPEFNLAIVQGPLTTDSLSGFKVTVQMQAPAGKTDSWQFNYVIKLHLANGSVISRQVAPCVLKSSSGGAASVAREIHL